MSETIIIALISLIGILGGTIGEIDRQLAAVEFFKNRGG